MKSSEARSPTQTADDGAAQPLAALGRRASMSSPEAIASAMAASVSYTHLTLPTIYSV